MGKFRFIQTKPYKSLQVNFANIYKIEWIVDTYSSSVKSACILAFTGLHLSLPFKMELTIFEITI